MDTSWEKLPEVDRESEENGAEATSPKSLPPPALPMTETGIEPTTDVLEKAWRRMAIKLTHAADVGLATKMIQEMREEATGTQNSLGCPHPEWAILESGNQHFRYETCLRCSSRVWTRPLTATERQAQLSRKAEKEARRAAKSKYQDPSPRMEDHGLVSVRKMDRASAAASSGSAGTTAETSSSNAVWATAAIQANCVVVSQLALAIQELTQRKI